jgi:hypothetical protein
MEAKRYNLLFLFLWGTLIVLGQQISPSLITYPMGCKLKIESNDTTLICILTEQEKKEMLDRIRSNAERVNTLIDSYTEPGDFNTPLNSSRREATAAAIEYYFDDPKNTTNTLNSFVAIYFDQERRKFRELNPNDNINKFLEILDKSVMNRTRYRYCQNYDPSPRLVSNEEKNANAGRNSINISSSLEIESEYYFCSLYFKEMVAFTNKFGYSYRYGYGRCKRIEAKVVLVYDAEQKALRWQAYFMGTYFEDEDKDENCVKVEDFKEGASCDRLDSIPEFQPTDFKRGDLAFIGIKAAQRERQNDQKISLMLMRSVTKNSHFLITNNEWRDNREKFYRNPKVEMKATFSQDCKYGEEIFFNLSDNDKDFYVVKKTDDGSTRLERAGYYEILKGGNISINPGNHQLFAYEVDTTSSGTLRKPLLIAGLMINKEKPGPNEPNWVPRQLSSTNYLQWVNFDKNEIGAIIRCDQLSSSDYRSENWESIRNIDNWKKIPKQLPPDTIVIPLKCVVENLPTDFVFKPFPIKSFVIPGLVLNEERKRKGKELKKISRGAIVGTIVVSGLASGTAFRYLRNGKYQDHLDATEFEVRDSYYKEAKEYERWSTYSFSAALAIWGAVDLGMFLLDKKHERINNNFFSSSLRNNEVNPTKLRLRLDYNQELGGVGLCLTKNF